MTGPDPTLPSHAVRRQLLERFLPEEVYDSREAFPSASVNEMLGDPNVELRRKDGTVIARPGPGVNDLNEAFFTAGGYRDGQPYDRFDHIAFPEQHHDYRAQARAMELAHPEYANVVYGHFAQDSTADKRFWLQYWYFMLYNDAQLLGQFGLHEGDWEMVQFRLAGAGPDWTNAQIDLAVYAQHAYAQESEIADLSMSERGTPVAFSALGSHAHYFESGIFKTEGMWDVCDGRGPRPQQTLVYLDENPPGWLSWPGTWGGTLPGIPGIESNSPDGPERHRQWQDPAYLAGLVRDPLSAQPANPKRIKIRRDLRHHPQIEFDFEDLALPAMIPGQLIATISPADNAALPATVAVRTADLLGGSVVLRQPLDPSVDYNVSVVWRDAANNQSDPVTAKLEHLPMSGTPVLRWILYGLRRLLQVFTPKG